jgi:hypothetical protein
VSDERTEPKDERNGRGKLESNIHLGTLSPDPWIYRFDANPSESSSSLGLSGSPNPSLVLAPESALSLLPSRGRGRDTSRPAPPAQIPTCELPA